MDDEKQLRQPANNDLLRIIVPVYDEGENFGALWTALQAAIRSPFEVYVIYDFDADNTIPAVQHIRAAREERLRLVKNNIRPGVVGAIRTGFQQVSQGPVLVIMADLSDDLSQVDEMLRLYRRGFHVVVGSRYMRGGKVFGGPLLKRALSRWAGRTLCWLGRLPTHDATNAFKLYDAAMLKRIKIESRGGFEINLELTVKAFLNGYRIAEIPTIWRDRTQGRSRFRLWAWLPRYLKWYVYALRHRRDPRPLQLSARPDPSDPSVQV